LVRAACPVQVDGRMLLATGGDDRTVRIWDPDNHNAHRVIPVHHPVAALPSLSGRTIAVGLTSGVLVLEVRP
jgi:hypothetical protein